MPLLPLWMSAGKVPLVHKSTAWVLGSGVLLACGTSCVLLSMRVTEVLAEDSGRLERELPWAGLDTAGTGEVCVPTLRTGLPAAATRAVGFS